MTIQITQPEAEEIVYRRLESGAFKDAEDVILQALRTSPALPVDGMQRPGPMSLRAVFEAVRGLGDDVCFERNSSAGRDGDSLGSLDVL